MASGKMEFLLRSRKIKHKYKKKEQDNFFD